MDASGKSVNGVNAWDAAADLSVDSVKAVIQKEFAPLCVERIEYLGEGWDSVVYLVNRGTVFKLPKREEAAKQLQLEATLLPQLCKILPLGCPNPTYVSRALDGPPWFVLGYPLIGGELASRRWASLEAKRVSACRLGEALGVLHLVPLDVAKSWRLEPDKWGRLEIGRKTPRALKRLSRCKELGYISSTKIYDGIISEALSVDQAKSELVPVHGDLFAKNMLVDRGFGRVIALLDWGDAHLNSRAIDLSVVFSYLPARVHEGFWNAYGHVGQDVCSLARFNALVSILSIIEYAMIVSNKELLADGLHSLDNLGARG
jgi:aminoglycoside phosphotransferase (APT) family kinase protein